MICPSPFVMSTFSYHEYSSKVWFVGFPDSSVGKESSCKAGYPSLIPGSGRSPGEGIGYPFQYSWSSLVAQLGKNLPAVWETWVGSLGWADPLEKGKATHSSILAWRIPWTSPWDCKELDMTEWLSLFLASLIAQLVKNLPVMLLLLLSHFSRVRLCVTP